MAGKKWTVWVGVGLMLLAMFGYLATLDESDPEITEAVVPAE